MARADVQEPCLDDRGPHRRCIVSATVRPREHLVRFVISPGGEITPDVAQRLPGRGFWLSADRDMIDRACAKKVFAKAARAQVAVSGTLADDVERLLVHRCQELIGLARRARQAVCGYAQTRDWLERGAAAVLLAARDGSEDQRRKMRGPAGAIVAVEALGGDELGAAFGRDHVVHGALAPGKLASGLIHEARRLQGLRKHHGNEYGRGPRKS
ncbi:MAG TPA: RNA-binding protein [Rhodospirillales bacterium]|nr:RNA-binding protein [Rhodospirillales bacterium]